MLRATSSGATWKRRHRNEYAVLCFVFATCLLLCTGNTSAFAEDKEGGSILFKGKLTYSLYRPATMPQPGTIEEIFVTTGQHVKEGQPLLSYKLDQEAREEIQDTLSPLVVLKEELLLEKVEVELAELTRAYAKARKMVEEGFYKAEHLRELAGKIEVARKERDFRARSLAASRSKSEEATKRLKQQLGEEILNDPMPEVVSLRSPIDGYVLKIESEIRKDAELLKPINAMTIGVVDPIYVQGLLYESEAGRVSLGDKALVTLNIFPGKTFEAEVSGISLLPESNKLDMPTYYDVECRLPNSEFLLKAGYTVEVEIIPSAKNN